MPSRRSLTAIQLFALTPQGREEGITGSPVADISPVAAVQVGAEWGKLSGMPGLPPGYVARDELAAVLDAVIAIDGGAVGLTGNVSTVGLHGQGGIGKSALAAAVARDEGIRRRFPDGVYWVTLGEKADVLAGQLDLLARLGARNKTPRTPWDAQGYLREVLADHRCCW
jgi:hypothetical protein